MSRQKRFKSILAWALAVIMTITLIPLTDGGSFAEDAPQEPVLSPEEVTEENVTEKALDTTTYDLGGGQKMTVFHGGAVRYEEANGTLTDYDPSLREETELDGYAYTNTAGDVKLFLPESINREIPLLLGDGEHQIATGLSAESAEVLSLEEATPVLAEETVPGIYEEEQRLSVDAVYDAPESAASLTYTSCDHGVKETLTLKEMPQTNTFRFLLDTGGLLLQEDAEGGAVLTDAENGEVVCTIEQPWMNDAGGQAYSEAIDLSFDKLEGEHLYQITMEADPAYLTDPVRQYPVTIDPTYIWRGNDEIRDAYVRSGNSAGTNFYSSSAVWMHTGKTDAGTYRTYLKLYGLKGKLQGQSISQANFIVYERGSGSSGQKVSAYRLTEGFNPKTITWNNKPKYNTSALDTVTITNNQHAAKTFDLKGFVKKVAAGTVTNYGIVLINTSSTVKYAGFYGSRSASSSYRPKLVVTYYSKPTKASSAGLSSNYGTDSTDITLHYSGIKSTGLDHCEYKIVAYNDQTKAEGNVVKAYSASRPATNGMHLPALSAGCYRVSVRGVNKAGDAGPGRSAGLLHIEQTQPQISRFMLPVTTEAAPGPAAPLLQYTAADAHFKEAGYQVDGGAYTKIGNELSGSVRISAEAFSGSGAHSITLTVRDKCGNTASQTETYYADLSCPKIDELYLADAGGRKISGQVTREADPQIIFKGLRDASGISAGGIRYALMEASEMPEENDFKSPQDLVLTQDPDGSYRGSFHLAVSDTQTQDGAYDLYVRIANTAGNESENVLFFTKDTQQPSGSIRVTDMTGNDEMQQLSDTVLITGEITSEDNSDTIAESSMKLYASENGTIIDPADPAAVVFSDVSLSAVRAFDTTKVPNGTYILGYRIEDSAGNLTTIQKDVTIANSLPQEEADSIDPIVQLTSFSCGRLTGTVTDDHLKAWGVYIRPSNTEDPWTKALSGTEEVSAGKLGFIDLSEPAYTAGRGYTLRLLAVDRAGNSAYTDLDITRDPDTDVAALIPAAFRIGRPQGQGYAEDTFTISPETESLSVRNSDTVSGSLSWYVNGSLKSTAGNYSDDFTCTGTSAYPMDTPARILAIAEDLQENKYFSRDVLQNGERHMVNLGSQQTIASDDPFVSFRLDAAADPGITYYAKIGSGSFEVIDPGERIFLCDMAAGTDAAEQITVKAIGAAANATGTLYLDTISYERFQISEAQSYAPWNFAVLGRLNYKTYLTWETEEESLPEDIVFEVYRSQKKDFTPGADSLIQRTSEHYYIEKNIGEGIRYYYRVRAVRLDASDQVISASGFSRQRSAKPADANEFDKRLGLKDCYTYAEEDTACGRLSAEESRGNLVLQQTDAELPIDSLDAGLTRTYNSMSSIRTSFGSGTSSTFDTELLALDEDGEGSDDTMILRFGDGSIYQFVKETQSSGEEDQEDDEAEEVCYISSMSKFISLSREEISEELVLPESGVGISTEENRRTVTVDSLYTARTKDDEEYRFNESGQLVLQTEPNGSFLLYTYDEGNGLLEKVVTSRGHEMCFSYFEEDEGDPLVIKEVLLPDGSGVAYRYEGDPEDEDVRLCEVIRKGKLGGEISYGYTYDAEGRITETEDPLRHRHQISYDGKGRVTDIEDPAGGILRLTYESTVCTKVQKLVPAGFLSHDILTEETDRFDGWFGHVIEHVDADGLTTSYAYHNDLIARTTTQKEYEVLRGDTVELERCFVTEKSSYDEDDDVTKETDSSGERTWYEYSEDEDKELASELVKNGDGKVTSDMEYEYDEAGNEIRSFDSVSGEEEETEYYGEDSASGLAGEIETEREIAGGVTRSETSSTYSYDANGILTETQTEACGGVVTKTIMRSDMMGQPLSEEELSGPNENNLERKALVTYAYDEFGRQISQSITYGSGTGAVTESTETIYNDNDQTVQETAADGTVTSYTYDALGRVLGRTVNNGSENKTYNTSYVYEPLTIYTGGGQTKSLGQALRTTQQVGTDIVSQEWTDGKGRTVKTFSSGLYHYQNYDASGNLIASYEAGSENSASGGKLTVSLYDAEGNQTHTIANASVAEGHYVADSSSAITETFYDCEGQEVKSTDAEGKAERFTYNVLGELTAAVAADGATTTYVYDKALPDGSESVTMKDPNSSISSTVTNARGLETRITDYRSNGTPGIQKTFTYDAKDQLIREDSLEGTAVTYAYDAQGRMSEKTLLDDQEEIVQKTEYSYDTCGRLIQQMEYFPSGGMLTRTYTKCFTYDAPGHLLTASDYRGDAAPSDPQISYEYDSRDRISKVSYEVPGSDIDYVRYIYDSHGWLSQIKVKNGLLEKTLREYTYDSFGRVSSIEDKYDPGSLGGTLTRSFSYDALDHITQITLAKGQTQTEQYGYAYDANGNITEESSSITYPYGENDRILQKSVSYAYDAAGRLTSVTGSRQENGVTSGIGRSYEYDAAGNRTCITEGRNMTVYTYNALDQMTGCEVWENRNEVSEVSFVYDDNGNQIRETDSILGTDITYAYDPVNQLTQVTRNENNVQTLSQENRYDGEGQRIQKSVQMQGIGNLAQSTRNYHYQNGAVLYTDDGSAADTFQVLGMGGNTISTVHPGPSHDEWYLYSSDIRGSITSLTDEDGDVAAAYEYDEFGETEELTGTGFDNELCHTGQTRDKETRLYYCNARYYEPTYGRFLTQDTYRGRKKETKTHHLYLYCNNDPINYIDPTGNDAILLKSYFLSRFVGHMGVLVKNDYTDYKQGNWKYFSWAKEGWESDYLGWYANTDDYYSVVGHTVYNDLNKRFKRTSRSKRYRKFIYISNANLLNSFNYINDVRDGKSYKKYRFKTRNCAWMALEVIKRGDITKKQKRAINKIQYRNKKRKKLRIVIPSKAFKKAAKIFDSEIENVVK